MKRLAFLLFFLSAVSAVSIFGQSSKNSSDRVWREIDDVNLQQRSVERTIVPSAYRTFTLNRATLERLLAQAPEEFTDAARNNEVILTLPMPDGTLQRFRFEHSLVVEPGLLVKFPELGKTYRGQGIDDPTASVRFDFLPSGFHSMIRSVNGTVLVDPYAKGDTENYISYLKQNAPQSEDFACHFGEENNSLFSFDNFGAGDFAARPDAAQVTSGANLRTYRLALAADGEYTAAAGGGTVAGALAAQVLIMNRVNGVYERDVAIHMNIIANNNLIIYTDAATDPYDNNNPGALLTQNQATLDNVIGTANYDIGHVFTTGGGGVAGLGVSCRTGNKARGETGLPNPVGDPFAIDFVAHELGHQWGGNHTFNGAVGNCSGSNLAANAAYEPGSGITIMAYAGICGNQNLAAHSIDTFHIKSINEIVSYSTTGTGNTCAVTTSTGNSLPIVSAGTGFTIPKQTPFALTATATDADGDSLTYDWQEYDLGDSTTTTPNSDADGSPRPIFRPYSPTTKNTRFFPSLQYILNNNNVPPTTTGGFLTGEILPSITRTMIFQVAVRDNRTNAGGLQTAFSIINVNGTSGPFVITAPNTTTNWAGNSSQTITWSVAGTDAAPVSAANVKISFSTDGGNTFPTVISASTPNDGTETITVPNVSTTQGRIKIEAVGNIFFDINGANITVNAVAVTNRKLFDFDGDGKADLGVFRPSNGGWYIYNLANGQNSSVAFGQVGDKIVPADYDGDGKTDIAVYRAGVWYLNRSQLGFTGIAFGASDDIPVPADFDGDGKAELVVFRPSTGSWFIYNLSNGQNSGVAFGQNGDRPIPADYDGDGKADYAVYRAGAWYLLRSQLGFTGVSFGDGNDLAVPADYDGDNKADIAVFRPSNGVWYLLQSTAGFAGYAFGQNGDAPTPADYDGDGKADIAVFRQGNWYLNRSTAGFTGVAFGATTDLPVSNAYVR